MGEGESGADSLVSAGLDEGTQGCTECSEIMEWMELSGPPSYFLPESL